MLVLRLLSSHLGNPSFPHHKMERLWSRALEFKARRGEFGTAGLTVMQRLDAHRQRLMIQGGAMYADLWLPRYRSTGKGPTLPLGLDKLAAGALATAGGAGSGAGVFMGGAGGSGVFGSTSRASASSNDSTAEQQRVDPVRGTGAYSSKACLWGAEGSPEAVVEEWIQQLESTDHAFMTYAPEVWCMH